MRYSRSRLFIAATLFVLIYCCLAAVADDLPKAPGAQVFSLTPEPGYFTAPRVAVNPADPQQVVAVFQDNAHAAYSQDAGKTWTVAEGVDPKNYRASGDVSTV